MSKHTLDLVAFTAQTWLIEPEAGAMLLAQLVAGNGTLNLELPPEEDIIHYADYNWVYYRSADKPGSIVIMSVAGTMYDFYANYYCAKLDLIYADPNVVGMVLLCNGPGGSANAGNKLADKVQAAPWPTVGYIDYGICGSANYMVACACDALYASRANDRIGSIGTYISYQDWSNYFKKLGIETKDLYAKQSTQKNEEFRQAAEGNFKLLQAQADQEAQRFIDYVKARRPALDASTNDPFKGRMFNATDALAIGLIDGIGDMKSAVKALANKTTLNTTPRTTTMLGFVKLAALAAVKGTAADQLSEAQLEAINTELNAAYPGLAIVTQAQLDEAVENANKAPDTAALTTAQNEVSRLTTELTTATSKITTLEGEKTTMQNKIDELGKLNGAEKTAVQKKNETVSTAEETETDTIIANLPHNKALEGSWIWENAKATEAAKK